MVLNLRARLIASFVLVILLALLSAGSAFVFLLSGYQTQLAKERVSRLIVPFAIRVRDLADKSSPAEIIPNIREQAAEANLNIQDIGILLVDLDGLVLGDTGQGLVGERIDVPPVVSWERRANELWSSQHIKGQDLFMASSARFWDLASQSSPPAPYSAILVVPEQNFAGAWMELVPTLAVSGLIAIAISVIVAFILSRSISRPVGELTRASQDMARGRYDQTIQIRGKDEIARLAATFNDMSKEVSRSNRTLRDFMANVSHALKTPLTSILGFSEAMVDGAITQPEEYAESGRIINEEAKRMGLVVEDLLRLSKIESGQAVMDTEVLDLAELVRSCIERLETRLLHARVKLSAELDAVPPVAGNAHWLENVFVELLDNAIRHTPEDGQITVRTCSLTAAGAGSSLDLSSAKVYVSIFNTGSFIPSSELARVFERFYRGNGSRGAGSTGLGLAIAREVVQAHGGSIKVRSEEQTGTEFIVSLPALNSAEA